ncbi:MAG: hypothetical protein AAGG75_07015 [Bacteroidota bacterium]
MKYIVLLCCLLPLCLSAQQNGPRRFRLPKQLPEVSGLYLQSPDSLWWHNDSGAPPTLFCTDARGRLLDSLRLPARNQDWEDLTADDRGNFYIGDFGNNSNARRDLQIYIYHPGRRQLDSIQFVWPDQQAFPPPKAQRNFDAEGFFWFRDSLHIFSKDHYRYGHSLTKHYILPAQPGRQSVLLRDSLQLPKRVVTAAAISPDGQTVALLSYTFRKVLGFIPWSAATIFYFRDFEGSHFLKGKRYKRRAPSFLLATQFESLDFLDNRQVYIASERTLHIRQKAKRAKLRKRHFKD